MNVKYNTVSLWKSERHTFIICYTFGISIVIITRVLETDSTIQRIRSRENQLKTKELRIALVGKSSDRMHRIGRGDIARSRRVPSPRDSRDLKSSLLQETVARTGILGCIFDPLFFLRPEERGRSREWKTRRRGKRKNEVPGTQGAGEEGDGEKMGPGRDGRGKTGDAGPEAHTRRKKDREKGRKKERKSVRKREEEREKEGARFTHPTSRTHTHASTHEVRGRVHVRFQRTQARRHFNTRHSCCRASGWFSWQRGWC